MKTLGEKIKAARQSRALSQQKLADLCGLKSQSRIYSYEKNKAAPPYEILKKIAAALKIDLSYFYRDVSEILEAYPTLPLIEWEDLEKTGKVNFSNSKYLALNGEYALSKKSFAVKLPYLDMTDLFPAESLLIVDPEKLIENNKYVLAYIDNKALIFKKIVYEVGEPWLVSNTNHFPPIKVTENIKIIGVVVGIKLEKYF